MNEVPEIGQINGKIEITLGHFQRKDIAEFIKELVRAERAKGDDTVSRLNTIRSLAEDYRTPDKIMFDAQSIHILWSFMVQFSGLIAEKDRKDYQDIMFKLADALDKV